jgi:hypothetical protein
LSTNLVSRFLCLFDFKTLVPNWSISRDDKVKLTKCQNHHHHGGVFDTWTEWARPQAERAKGSAGRPGLKSVPPVASCTRVYTRRGRPRRWRKVVEAIPPSWLATTWRVTAPAKLVDLPHGPINTPPPSSGNQNTHHYMEILLAKLSSLVQ